MISFIIAIIVLGLIVTFHELGHFLFSRLFSVKVINFSLGMGPELWSFVRGDTEYSLRAVPFGGSCMMDEDDFLDKAPWKRFFIVLGGPLFNLILAFLLSLVLTADIGADIPFVAAVEKDMPAYDSGLSEGDIITCISFGEASADTHVSRDLYLFLYIHGADLTEDTVINIRYMDPADGEEGWASFRPAYSEETGSYRMGISYNMAYLPIDSPMEVIRYGAYNLRYNLVSAVESVKLLLSGGAERTDVMGPVRIVGTIDDTVSEASDYGIRFTLMTIFNIMIVISVSLGVMNLLPIPALDGGRLIFILIELIFRKPVPRKLEAAIHMGGMALLLLLMMLILFNDISLLA